MRQNRRHQENKLNNRRIDMFQDSNGLSEEERKLQEERKKKIRKRLIAAAVVEVCILMMMSYAWYYYLSHRKVYSGERDVMSPYYLYLVEPNGTDALNLTVGNLHPGETKQIIVGVCNKEPGGESTSYEIGKDSKFNYEFELAYTQNLPVNYIVYELTETQEDAAGNITVEWSDGNQTIQKQFTKTALTPKGDSESISKKNNEEMYGEKVSTTVNQGKYDIYDKAANGNAFDLTTTVATDGTVGFDLDYYMIEINWQDGINFSDYLKETDLVYVIVKAMQLEPEEAATAETTP
ncbi:MAG: hypothetical protein PUC12_01505 [Clostridiales bacterium]|nr:hypothetical protein [Clostridiales bacterium]